MIMMVMISCSELAATGGCLVDIVTIMMIRMTVIMILTMMLIRIIYNVDQDEDFSIWWNLNALEGLGLAETLALWFNR